MSSDISSIRFDGTILPDFKQAQDLFGGLERYFWKQIIDGKYHEYGPEVFDKALHKGPMEPGFINSLRWGFFVARDSLTQPLTVVFYKLLHSRLCDHFDGKRTNTQIGKDKIGMFRNESVAKWSPSAIDRSKEAQHHHEFIKLASEILDHNNENEDQAIQRIPQEWRDSNNLANQNKEKVLSVFREKLKASEEWYRAWEDRCRSRANYLSFEVEKDAETHGVEPYCTIQYARGRMHCRAVESDQSKLEKVVGNLLHRYATKMDDYNQKLKTCNDESLKSFYGERKLEEIAFLFQHLEWLHPFQDGQGRTDLMLLSKLLTEQGFSPAILDDPYMSSFSTLDDWVDYLKRGMERWQVALKDYRRAKEVQPMKDE